MDGFLAAFSDWGWLWLLIGFFGGLVGQLVLSDDFRG
jgi:hypothetical protein